MLTALARYLDEGTLFVDLANSKSMSATNSKAHGVDANSQDELEYFRHKCVTLLADNQNFQKQLDQISKVFDNQCELREKLRESENTARGLRNEISRIQEALHEERNRVLNLYAENDRLKLREMDDRRDSQRSKGQNTMNSAFKRSNHSCEMGDPEYRDLETANRAVLVLQKQLEEQKKAADDRILSLLSDQKQCHSEEAAQIEEFRNRELEMLDQLKCSHQLIQELANEYLHLRLRGLVTEKMSQVQNSPTLSKVTKTVVNDAKENLTAEFLENICASDTSGVHRREKELRKLVCDLESGFQRQFQLTSKYVEQVAEMERKNHRLLQECKNSNQAFQEEMKKLKELNQLHVRRYQDLEERRKLENEGFRNDINALRKRLAETEAMLRILSEPVGRGGIEAPLCIDRSTPKRPMAVDGRSPQCSALVEELKKLRKLMVAFNSN